MGAAAALFNGPAHLNDISGLVDKRGGDEVNPLLHSESDVIPVPIRYRWQRRPLSGDVDLLLVGEGAAADDPTADQALQSSKDLKLNIAVVQEHRCPHRHVPPQVTVVNEDPLAAALYFSGHKGKLLAVLKLNKAAGKSAKANLRTLGVHHDCYGCLDLAADILYRLNPLRMVCLGAVAQVQADDINPSANEALQDVPVICCRSQGGNDLGSPHYSLLIPLPVHVD